MECRFKLLIKNAFKHHEPNFIWYRLDQHLYKESSTEITPFKSAGAPQFLGRTGAPAPFGLKPRFSGAPVNRGSPNTQAPKATSTVAHECIVDPR